MGGRAEERDNFVSGDTAEGEDSEQGQGSMGDSSNEKDSDLERQRRTSNPPGNHKLQGCDCTNFANDNKKVSQRLSGCLTIPG